MPPGHGFGGYLMVMATWAAIGVYWFARLVGAMVAGGRRAVLGRWVRWLIAPAIVLVTVGLIVTSAPLHARVAVSLRAMNDLARAAMDAPVPGDGVHSSDSGGPGQLLHPAEFPERVGMFPVTRVDAYEGGMRFLVTGEGVDDSTIPPLVDYSLDEYGFAYSPSGRPPRIGEDTYWHLRGAWYLWEESW
ncbi:MAG TPA: hypothetical protein VIG64_15040 [Actinomycetota bacterium]|jgi:hypothetical protein